jgi:hypothetical protein
MNSADRDDDCLDEMSPVAADVARGVIRLFSNRDWFGMCEVPLPNGRRADLMAVDAKGHLAIVEIKVSKADLLGDCKWRHYLDYCDRFFWAVPQHLCAILDDPQFMPTEAGVLVADRYDAAVLREAAFVPLSGARRKAETLRFARRAAWRLSTRIDPELVIAR